MVSQGDLGLELLRRKTRRVIPEQCKVKSLPNQEMKQDAKHGFHEDGKKLCAADFEILCVVGQGGFGKVFQVRRKGTTDDIYAMKVIRKDILLTENCERLVKSEKDILAKLGHPFIAQLRYSFQTESKLYLILDYINGGSLLFHLDAHGMFSEDLARFYIAEIVCAVSYLHKNGIIHRDLKPDNILLDCEGHVKLVDFGLAVKVDYESIQCARICGTAQYMAPETFLFKCYGKLSDWWSVGIILYSMLAGKAPFIDEDMKKLQEAIAYHEVKLPSYLTSEAHSLITGLLQKDPNKRLGSGVDGSDEIKNHKWFQVVNWKKLEERCIQPILKPNVSGKDCTANFVQHWTSMKAEDSPPSSPKSYKHFSGYTYVSPA